jgi:hypothetical protein
MYGFPSYRPNVTAHPEALALQHDTFCGIFVLLFAV